MPSMAPSTPTGYGMRRGSQGLIMSRPIEELPEQYRDWLIDFGDSGYVALH
jgi:hypothetical protein